MAGGIAGSLARAWVAEAYPHSAATWPWSTVIVNVVGSGALGLLLVLLMERFPTSRNLRPLFATGVLGGFTTFSTFAVDAVQMAHAGRTGLAGLYVLVTLIGTTAAALLGMLVGRTADRLTDRDRWERRIRVALDRGSAGNES
jgi:CrcB protein